MFKILFCFLILISACNQNKIGYLKATNGLDAAREFIDGCLKGDFEKASFYMLEDDVNKSLLKKLSLNYSTKSNFIKNQYKESSIIINEQAYISDSLVIINYKNSFDKYSRKVKAAKQGLIWLIDLKYSSDGNL